MSAVPETAVADAIWLNTSSSLHCFAQPLLQQLGRQIKITPWQYHQQLDEECSLEKAMLLLHQYLNSFSQPVHLIGHSTSGLLGLLYARQYPERVKSLTVLAVGVDIAVDWQFHYYKHRLQLGHDKLLLAMAYNLFGYQAQYHLDCLIQLLEQDLTTSLSPHSLFRQLHLLPCEVNVPLLVCGSQDDIVVDTQALQSWQPFLKQGDRLWFCPGGGHFFHFFQAHLLAEQVLDFWQHNRPPISQTIHSNLTSAIVP
jgi:pimeloyl-ACP methyl ester carboxylesterase